MPRRSRIPLAPAALLVASVIVMGCNAEIPAGIFACQTASDCPNGFVCRTDPASDDLRCYATGTPDTPTGKAGGPDEAGSGGRAAGGEAGAKAAGRL
jgi:hypothetical protein